MPFRVLPKSKTQAWVAYLFAAQQQDAFFSITLEWFVQMTAL